MTSHRFVLASALIAGMTGAAFAADVPVREPIYTKAPAQGLVSGGFMEAYLGGRLVDSENSSDRTLMGGAILGGNAFYNLPLASNFSAQFDAQGEWYTNAPPDGPRGAGALTAHLSARDPQKGLFGIFGSVVHARDKEHPSGKTGWIAGAESQIYSGNTTYYLQAGYGNIEVDSDPEGFLKGWFVRGVTRHFTTDDSMIQAELAYGRNSRYIDGDDWGKFWNWSLKSVQRLGAGSPMYGTLEYRGAHYMTNDQGGDITMDHALIVGLMVPLGNVKSLKHNDRYGATLDTPMLPGRAAANAERLD